jgi:hypothetical protein
MTGENAPEGAGRRSLRQLAGHYWQLTLVLAFTAVLLLCGLSYGYGFSRGHGYQDAWLAELQDLRRQQQGYEQHIAEVKQELVNLRQGARIDREAAEQVREEVLASEVRIAALKADLVFYRGLMTPTATEQGLGIRSFTVYTTGEPRVYRYDLVVQQLAVKHALLKGQVRLKLRGKMAGAELALSLQQLSPDEASEVRTFRFRYFQKLEGTIRLPQGFAPETIELSAETKGKWGVRVENQFQWQAIEV